MKFVCLVCLILVAFGCTNPPYRGGDVLGADEFVMDSYKIREGKFAILQMEGKETSSLDPTLLQEFRDVVHEDDLLNIALYHPTRDDLVRAVATVGSTVGFRVLQGKVLLPEIGAISVSDLTLDEARDEIRGRYLEQISDVEVFVDYKDRLERKVELAGLVSTPAVPIDGRIRLFEVLSKAKVPSNANFFKSYVVRNDLLVAVDLYKLIKEGDMGQNIVMRGGDKVYIAEPSASSLMVLGEVGRERVVDLPSGFMTLRHAIAEAGGIAPTGDKAFIQIIRGNVLHPRIYTLHWEHVVRLPDSSLLLMPGDIVYVAATPITEWNRFASQLLPTFVGFDIITKGIRSVGVTIP